MAAISIIATPGLSPKRLAGSSSLCAGGAGAAAAGSGVGVGRVDGSGATDFLGATFGLGALFFFRNRRFRRL
ncbi:MAG TPA: hypothetical protein DEB46_14525, partial [Myxococcales bacterium]|nr:hypothetical protein [Myxococcales bacterium]